MELFISHRQGIKKAPTSSANRGYHPTMGFSGLLPGELHRLISYNVSQNHRSVKHNHWSDIGDSVHAVTLIYADKPPRSTLEPTKTCFVTSLHKPGMLYCDHASLNTHPKRQKLCVIASQQSKITVVVDLISLVDTGYNSSFGLSFGNENRR